MEKEVKEKKKSKIIIFLIVIIAMLLGLVGYFGYQKYFKDDNKKLEQEENKQKEEQDEFIIDSNNQFGIGENHYIYDSKLNKAQNIAKETQEAFNNKDWYYLAKIMGESADIFIKYGIYNYSIDLNSCRKIEEDLREEIKEEYVFTETYELTANKREELGLGNMFIVTFFNGGRITVIPFATGI